jgi:hypothetical protein
VTEIITGGFDEYPINKVEDGKILLSGIVLGEASLVPLNQPFLIGKIVFNTVASGLAELDFEFQPGSDRDCNVAQSKLAKDILREVEGASLTLK